MSYTVKRHDRGVLRKNNYKHMKRKEKILKSWGEDALIGVSKNQPHRLSKGKVHCSCLMCQDKTRNKGWKHSDLVNLEKWA